jgi:RNA polymerase sigma-70 factor (ECF subfamily)
VAGALDIGITVAEVNYGGRQETRLVVTLRDVQGFSADEVRDLLDVSPGNQRILLHRGRGALRAALAAYYRA